LSLSRLIFYDVFNVLFLPPGQYERLEILLNNPPKWNSEVPFWSKGFIF
jgi:hypothetical protein